MIVDGNSRVGEGKVYDENDKLDMLWAMQNSLNMRIGRDTINDPQKELWGLDLIFAMEQEIAELKDCYNWKWWSKHHRETPKGTVINRQNALVEYVDILHFFISLGQTLGFTPDELFRIYKEKWKVNQRRQDNNYNSLNKTEEDNLDIV